MTRWRFGGALAVLAFLALAAWMAWSAAKPSEAASQKKVVEAPTLVGPPQLPGRTYLAPEQLHHALATGELDRPVTSLLKVGTPLAYGDFRWDDNGVGAGATWIRVDLRRQILSVFRDGNEIGTAVILYGAKTKETHPGLYHILAKAKNHRSSLYDAEMPYTLRLTDDGVSIHGSNVRWGAATHGCIGVPMAFAQKLFAAVSTHDDVVILRNPVGGSALANS